MLALLHSILDLLAALPRVESPWPRSVGLSLPFTWAGIGGVLGNVLSTSRRAEEQAQMASLWGLRFFWFGTLLYGLLLLNQLLSFG